MEEILNNPGFYVSYAVIQAIVVLLLIRLLDYYDRQPLGLLAVMAFWGATGAALIALAGNRIVRAMLSDDARDVFGNAISPPIVEEGAKGLALLAAVGPIRWAGRRFGMSIFEGVTAGMVYGAAVGLGFAFTEDVFYFVNEAQAQGLEGGLDVFVHRRDFFGPAMLHHPLWTAAFGAGLGAAAWTKSPVRKVVYPLLGFTAAVLMHAINNGLVELVLWLRYGMARTASWARGEIVDPALREHGLDARDADQPSRLLRPGDVRARRRAVAALPAPHHRHGARGRGRGRSDRRLPRAPSHRAARTVAAPPAAAARARSARVAEVAHAALRRRLGSRAAPPA